jgi:predicted GTPase
MALDATAATMKWQQRMQAAGQQITEGVNAVTVSPGASAAKQVNKWLARIQESAGKWQRNVGAVTLEDWRTAMISRGIPNIATGVQAKSAHYTAFATKFYGYLSAGKAKIDAMPTDTLQQAIAKATAQIQYNAAYKGGGGRHGA